MLPDEFENAGGLPDLPRSEQDLQELFASLEPSQQDFLIVALIVGLAALVAIKTAPDPDPQAPAVQTKLDAAKPLEWVLSRNPTRPVNRFRQQTTLTKFDAPDARDRTETSLILLDFENRLVRIGEAYSRRSAVLISNGKTWLIHRTGTTFAVESPADEPGTFRREGRVPSTSEYLGEVRVLGLNADHYRFFDPESALDYEDFWWGPIHLGYEGTNAASKARVSKLETVAITIDPPLEGALFQLPPDLKRIPLAELERKPVATTLMLIRHCEERSDKEIVTKTEDVFVDVAGNRYRINRKRVTQSLLPAGRKEETHETEIFRNGERYVFDQWGVSDPQIFPPKTRAWEFIGSSGIRAVAQSLYFTNSDPRPLPEAEQGQIRV